MKKLPSVLAAMLLSLGLVAATSGAATAAPGKPDAPGKPATQTVSIQSGLLQLGAALGLFSIEAFGGAEWDGATGTLTSNVNGNPEKSQRVIHNGGLTLSKADGSSLTIQNIHWDMKRDIVTGVIDGERVVLYTTVDTGEYAADLYVDPEGGALLRAFVNFLGLPADGSHFGTIWLN